ncbi:MAG: ABC transporter permease/substrate-binding protein [Acidobacteria bacterium]|nr:ABC transporter permease/substrate-binding protein [Acidobacteriota bacterium]
MNFVDFIKANWSELLTLTREHIFLVLISTGAAVLIGLPTGVLLTRVKALRAPVIGFANVMQTVPSLALFGLLIPIPFIGGIGARTAIIALALYALLPVIRNTVTGILGIDPKLSEAAIAMGMTPSQRLRIVELPLAMPVIITGIRVAVVISVGVATVAAAVGAGGLGTYIFRGLRQNDNNLILAGALASALLALICDFALGQFEKTYAVGAKKPVARRWLIAAFATMLIAAVTIAGSRGRVIADPAAAAAKTVAVGSKDFTESVILAEILSELLEKRGVPVIRQFELGGNLAHDSLVAGRIDVYPEYTGTAYTAILKHPPITDTKAVYDQVKSEYASKLGLTVGPPLGFSNDFAILIRGNVARQHNLKTISDAVQVSKDWQAGFGQDFMSRADGYEGFRKAYEFSFNKTPREMDLSLTYRALAASELDIIAGNSTDGLISALDLYQLQDDRHYFPPYQAVFVEREDAGSQLNDAIDFLQNKISTDDMRALNYSVDGDKRSPRDVAAEWLKKHSL